MTTRLRSDAGKTIGMSIALASTDLEACALWAATAGFDALEIFVSHLGPAMVDVPITEAHARAARDVMIHADLAVSTLNVIVDGFQPVLAERIESSCAWLEASVRTARALGSPRVLVWDGEASADVPTNEIIDRLVRCIEVGVKLAGDDGPEISVEFHPNTFALARGVHHEVAGRLGDIGAGVCVDFCHFGVALGADFADRLDDDFLAAVNHLHVADTDLLSEQLHFPLGAGSLDLVRTARRFADRGLAAAWDMFGWPAPRRALSESFQLYRELVDVVSSPSEGSS